MENLAWLYYQLECYQECISLYQHILEAYVKEHGAHSLEAADAMNNLAMTYTRLGNYAEMFSLMQQVYDLHKELLGEEHPETQKDKEWLAAFRRHLLGST